MLSRPATRLAIMAVAALVMLLGLCALTFSVMRLLIAWQGASQAEAIRRGVIGIVMEVGVLIGGLCAYLLARPRLGAPSDGAAPPDRG